MNYRKTYYSLLILSICICLAAISGCSSKSDACATTHCLNSGTCADGSCSCPPHYSGQYCDSCSTGYEGTDCNTATRSKFAYIGYNVSETRNGSPRYNYTSSIRVSPTQIDQVYIQWVDSSYFINSVSATCRGNIITIPRQKPDLDPIYVQGSGTISGGVISLDYQITDSTTSDNGSYSSTWTR